MNAEEVEKYITKPDKPIYLAQDAKQDPPQDAK